MEWVQPLFKEISLSGEVTAYVNTDMLTETRKEMQGDHWNAEDGTPE